LNPVSDHHLDGEIVAEEDAAAEDAVSPVRRLPEAPQPHALVLRGEVKTAAIAAAGGVLAGAATVAAVRAVSAVGSRASSSRRLTRRRRPAGKVIASRSFLVDVHLLDR
jgi:hypothetical protein